MKTAYILGGGTFSHVRNHLALAAPAFGTTAKLLSSMMYDQCQLENIDQWHLILTKMADETSSLITNDDVSHYVDQIIKDPHCKIVFFNVALCDFTGQIGYIVSGKHAERLHSNLIRYDMTLSAAPKILGKIRAERKDIFLVAFKTTTGASEQEQYIAGLQLLKQNSCNLVLANDTVTRLNMIIVPEEAKYEITQDRNKVLHTLVEMTIKRSQLHYTRSTVVNGDLVPWDSQMIPESFRTVVNHCIKKGAYKPFRENTAGHFAVKLEEGVVLTTKRKTNYNRLSETGQGLVEIHYSDRDQVIAFGGKPSVGGQSQRAVFKDHPEMDCIVHFHCPRLRYYNFDSVATQQWIECGSHECGENTSKNLKEFIPGIKAVYLDNHGPNIVFNRNIDPKKVIDFIDWHFDLSAKTGGLVA